MRLLIILFLFFLTSTGVFGQAKFGPGFYVDNTGDTIQGFIQYKTSYIGGFLFRSELKGSNQHLSVEQAMFFGFNSGATYMQTNYSENGSPSEKIFAKILVEGEINLAIYKGKYIMGSKEHGNFVLGKPKASNETEAVKNYQKNVGAFTVLFQACPAVGVKAQKSVLSESSLTELLKEYHSCRDIPYKEFHIETKKIINIGLFGGASFTGITFSENVSYNSSSFLYHSNFPTSIQPTIGAMVLIHGKAPSSIFSVQGELIYSKADFKATYISSNETSGYTLSENTTTEIDYNRLGLRAGIRLTGRSNSLNPYLSFGVSMQTFLSFNSKVNQTIVINSYTEVNEFNIDPKSSSIAAWGSLGLKKNISGKKIIFFDILFESGQISNGGQIKSISPRVGYLF